MNKGRSTTNKGSKRLLHSTQFFLEFSSFFLQLLKLPNLNLLFSIQNFPFDLDLLDLADLLVDSPQLDSTHSMQRTRF